VPKSKLYSVEIKKSSSNPPWELQLKLLKWWNTRGSHKKEKRDNTGLNQKSPMHMRDGWWMDWKHFSVEMEFP
jgi:hypothetical protein